MKGCVIALAVFAAFAASPSSSLAQDRKGDVAGGWQYLHAFADDDEGTNVPKGFFVDGAGNITSRLAVVGELSASFKSVTETIVDSGVTVDLSGDLRVATFMGGIRVGSPAGQALRPFAQVLLGGVRRTVDVEGSATVGGVTISESDSDSSTDFGVDLGGGVDFLLNGGVGVRAKASYLRVTGDSGGNAFRFQAGVVIPF